MQRFSSLNVPSSLSACSGEKPLRLIDRLMFRGKKRILTHGRHFADWAKCMLVRFCFDHVSGHHRSTSSPPLPLLHQCQLQPHKCCFSDFLRNELRGFDRSSCSPPLFFSSRLGFGRKGFLQISPFTLDLRIRLQTSHRGSCNSQSLFIETDSVRIGSRGKPPDSSGSQKWNCRVVAGH